MIETGTLLDVIRLVLGTIVLAYASFTDIKTRRASNMLWVIMGATGAILLVVQYFTTGFADKILYLVFVPIMIILMYVLFQLRLIFGGADAKAIMALAILVPLEPALFGFPIWKTLMPFSWVIFSNSLILFILIPVSLLIFNIAKRNIEFPYIFLGYRMSIDKAKEKFVWPLEKLVDGKRKFSYMPKEFDVEKELEAFEKKGMKEIWVTPKIPFMIPLLAGFLCSFFIGDILFHLMNSIL